MNDTQPEFDQKEARDTLEAIPHILLYLSVMFMCGIPIIPMSWFASELFLVDGGSNFPFTSLLLSELSDDCDCIPLCSQFSKSLCCNKGDGLTLLSVILIT